MQEGGAMMVKLEGGKGQISIVEYLAQHDIPVCAHLGAHPKGQGGDQPLLPAQAVALLAAAARAADPPARGVARRQR